MATSSQENNCILDQSIPQWKRELILRRRTLARTLPAGNTSVKLTCPSVVTAVRHPELVAVAAGENVSGKQQRCISSAIASNKGILDQTQADFHPRGRINDSSSASPVSASVVGNMRLVEQVEGDTDLMINGVGLDLTVEQNSVKYLSRMGEEKFVKISSASSITIVDNCVMTKNRLVMSENNNCQHSNEEECQSDSSEELQYGPGIVNKLKCRYMSMTLRENQNKGVRPSLSNMRRAASLENMLDNDTDAGNPQITTQHRFTKRTDATNNSKAEHVSQHQQRYRPTSRRNESMKRARSVETLLRYDPKSHTATGHSIPSDLPVCDRVIKSDLPVCDRVIKSDLPVCDRVIKSEFRDCNKNNTNLLKALGNEEIVIVENKMKIECPRKTLSEEKVPMFQQKKRTTNIPEETELPPPDVVKQTLKIFEGTHSKKSSRLTRVPGVSKTTSYKHNGTSVAKVGASGVDIKGSLSSKPTLSPKPVLSPEKNSQNIQSPRKLPPPPPPPILPPEVPHSTPSPSFSSRILALDTLTSVPISPIVSPTGNTRLKSPSPTGTAKQVFSISESAIDEPILDTPTSLTNGKIAKDLSDEENSSDEDTTDHVTKPVSRSALDNIRKDGTSMEFRFSNSSTNAKSKSYLPGTKSPAAQPTVTSNVFARTEKITSPILERQDFVTSKCTSSPPAAKSPDSPQTQMRQVGIIRPNNAHPTSPSLTHREIEKNYINRTKSIEQPTSAVVVSFKSADDVVVGKVSVESVKGRSDDNVKSVRDLVTLRSSDLNTSRVWDSKPYHQQEKSMVFNFINRKGPVPSYIENDGMIRTNRRNLSKTGEHRTINVDGTSDESSTDIDADDYTVGFGSPPSPCNVLFEGDNILINGKSNLLKQPKQRKLRIKFNDAATTTFEYPSEASLINETSSSSSSVSSPPSGPVPSPHTGLPIPLSPSGPTPGVPVPLGGSSLASYTPSKIHLGSEDFQLGVTRAAPLLPPRTTDTASSGSKQKEEEEEYLKPAEDSETVAWSAETASDLLF